MSLHRSPAVLALLAVALFVLGPVCSALQTAQAHADAEVCCTSLTDASMLPAGTAATFTGDPGGIAVPLAPVARAFARASFATARDPSRSPPRSLPYHARTARILA